MIFAVYLTPRFRAVPGDFGAPSLFCEKFGALVEERGENMVPVDKDGVKAAWNSIGALHSVKVGDTPKTAPKDYRMFTPR